MKPAKLVFIEQFYYPEGWGGAELPRDLTAHLAQHGFDVEVICGKDKYVALEDAADIDPASFGIRIRRVPAFIRGDAHSFKFLRQAWFYLAAIPILFIRRPPALYVVQTNPPLAVVLAAIAARLQRRPLIIIAMDVYPEVAEAHGMLRGGSLLGRMVFGVYRRSYRAARCVVALGPVMKTRLIAKGVPAERIVEISNWSTGRPGIVRGDANGLRGEWNLKGRFVLVYSGNLGVGHEFDTLLNALNVVRKKISNIALVIIGGGSRLQQVRDRVAELMLTEFVIFSDFLPAARLPESLGLADMALVTLRPGFEGLIVPSKVLSYMSRGIPILYIGPQSDVDCYIQRCGCGVALRNGAAQEVAQKLTELNADPQTLRSMGTQAKLCYDSEFSREHGLARYDALIRSCL